MIKRRAPSLYRLRASRMHLRTAGPFVQYNITQSTTPTLPNDTSVLPAMHSFLRLLSASLLLLPLLALAAPPPAASLSLQ